MKCYSANVWETLIEALHIYWQVIKECCPLLLAIFVPYQLVMALYRYSVASSGVENLGNLRFENIIAAALGLTLGLVAVAIVVDCVFRKCTGQRRPSGGGIAAAWGRMMATGFERMLVEAALVIVAIIALVIVMIFASNAPLTQVGGSASAFSAIIACIILAPLVVAIVWILVRWSFAIILSAIHPIMGFTAMGESSRFVRGRFAWCLLMVVAAWLVMSGISAIPSSLASWYSRGEMVGLPAPSGTVLARTVVLFFGDLFVSFGSLFMPVALTTFWIRTVIADPDERAPLQSYMEIETQPHSLGYDANDIGMEDVIALCERIGAKPFFTINAAWESPQDSADWVKACRGRVKLWSLGNEMGYHHMEGPKGAKGYAQMVRPHAEAMLKVDPALTIVSSGPYPGGGDDWINNSAKAMADVAPVVSYHRYDNPGIFDFSTPGRTAALFDRMDKAVDRAFNALRDFRQRLPKEIGISYDEWNIWYAWYHEEGIIEGLYAAKMLNGMMRNISFTKVAGVLNRKSTSQLFAGATPVSIHCAPVERMEVYSFAMLTPTVCMRKKRRGRPSRSAAGTSYS